MQDCPTELGRAIRSLVYWSDIIQRQKPDLTFRIEDPVEPLLAFLKRNGFKGLPSPNKLDIAPVNKDKTYRGVVQPKPDLTLQDWASVDDETWKLLEEYCNTYRYDPPKMI